MPVAIFRTVLTTLALAQTTNMVRHHISAIYRGLLTSSLSICRANRTSSKQQVHKAHPGRGYKVLRLDTHYSLSPHSNRAMRSTIKLGDSMRDQPQERILQVEHHHTPGPHIPDTLFNTCDCRFQKPLPLQRSSHFPIHFTRDRNSFQAANDTSLAFTLRALPHIVCRSGEPAAWGRLEQRAVLRALTAAARGEQLVVGETAASSSHTRAREGARGRAPPSLGVQRTRTLV